MSVLTFTSWLFSFIWYSTLWTENQGEDGLTRSWDLLRKFEEHDEINCSSTISVGLNWWKYQLFTPNFIVHIHIHIRIHKLYYPICILYNMRRFRYKSGRLFRPRLINSTTTMFLNSNLESRKLNKNDHKFSITTLKSNMSLLLLFSFPVLEFPVES